MNHSLKIFRSPDGEGEAGAGDGEGAGGGTAVAAPEWVSTLPEEAQKDPNILKYKTSDDFYKGYKNQVELIGKKGVIVPDDKTTPEDREKFLNAIGRPEKPEGYKLSKIDGLHKAIEITPESMAGFQTVVHKIGLTNTQADEINKFQIQVLNQSVVQQEKAEQKKEMDGETALRKDWGQDYDKNMQTITKFLMKAGGQEAVDSIGGGSGIKKNPIVAKALAEIFSQLNEDSIKFVGGNSTGAGTGGNETKEEALAKIKKMQEAPDFASILTNTNHKDNKSLNAERIRLHKIAYPD